MLLAEEGDTLTRNQHFKADFSVSVAPNLDEVAHRKTHDRRNVGLRLQDEWHVVLHAQVRAKSKQ